jgi:hypothetical protein
MTHAALSPDIGREFDPFLFASVGEDRHGQLLSVISVLARSDLDPWREAVGLARMSQGRNGFAWPAGERLLRLDRRRELKYGTYRVFVRSIIGSFEF